MRDWKNESKDSKDALMRSRLMKALKVSAGIVATLFVLALIAAGPTLYRLFAGLGIYETVPPELPSHLNETAILIFSKTNGFRHEEAIPAAINALEAIARRRGWSTVATDNGAVFNADQLERFRAVVWNNTSGDVLRDEQRAAFRDYIERGGGFVGIHGAGGDFSYKWKWYVDTLLGAQFTHHTMSPQFQETTVHIEQGTHPITRHLGKTWSHVDEWYSFATNPRQKGYKILATIDERAYNPKFLWFKSMGDDHPVMWCQRVGDGRAFYSALGHPAGAYSEPEYVGVLENAIAWAAGLSEENVAETPRPPA
jgi:hypothetical protein